MLSNLKEGKPAMGRWLHYGYGTSALLFFLYKLLSRLQLTSTGGWKCSTDLISKEDEEENGLSKLENTEVSFYFQTGWIFSKQAGFPLVLFRAR